MTTLFEDYTPAQWPSLPFQSWQEVLAHYYSKDFTKSKVEADSAPELMDDSEWPSAPKPFTDEQRREFERLSIENGKTGVWTNNPFAADYEECLAVSPANNVIPERQAREKRGKKRTHASKKATGFVSIAQSEAVKAKPFDAAKGEVRALVVPSGTVAVFTKGSQIVHWQIEGKKKTACGKAVFRSLTVDELADPMYSSVCAKCRKKTQ